MAQQFSAESSSTAAKKLKLSAEKKQKRGEKAEDSRETGSPRTAETAAPGGEEDNYYEHVYMMSGRVTAVCHRILLDP